MYSSFFLIIVSLLFCTNPLSARSSKKRHHQNKTRSYSMGNWHSSELINPTEKQPARTAILIIVPRNYDENFVGQRWRLGKIVWEQYRDSHPNIDCYFIKCTFPRKGTNEQVWQEGNTISVGDEWSANTGRDKILHKSIKTMEFLSSKYTHFIRTNVNSFFNLNAVHNYVETHHQSMYTTPLWQSEWYSVGYAILFTADVARHMVNEYNRLNQNQEELISQYHSDDAVLTALATGIWPYGRNPFKCCPSLKPGIRQLMCNESLNGKRLTRYGALLSPISSLEETLKYCKLASNEVMIYRTRDGLSLRDLCIYYKFLLEKIYRTRSERISGFVKK